MDGHCGIVNVNHRDKRFEEQPCQIAAVVPQGKKEDGGWTASEWLSRGVSLSKSCDYIFSFGYYDVTFITYSFSWVLFVLANILQEERRMAMFAQYAMAAAEEALEDAGWKPTAFEQREATVSIFLLYHYGTDSLNFLFLRTDSQHREFVLVLALAILMRSMIQLSPMTKA